MRYRITFEGSIPVEIYAFDLRVIGARRINVITNIGGNVEILFGTEIKRIADDHDRDIYIK